jgi:hypothetical protein
LYHITAPAPMAKTSHTVSSVENLKRYLPAITAQAMIHAGKPLVSSI